MAEPINYDQYRLGTKDGEIKFGAIHADGETAAVKLTSGDAGDNGLPHYISLDKTGNSRTGRKGSTTVRCPGVFQVRAGDTVDSEESIPGVFIDAVSGDLVLSAQSGRIRIMAENIELIARGADGENGNVIIDANEKAIINGDQAVSITSEASVVVRSENKTEIIGNSTLDVYGGLIEFIEGTSTIKGSKGIVPGLPGTLKELLTAIRNSLS